MTFDYWAGEMVKIMKPEQNVALQQKVTVN